MSTGVHHHQHAYVLLRSPRKTIAIHVKAGQVEVRAPLRVSLADIDVFVRAKNTWITRKLAEIERRTADVLQFIDGSFVDVMGERLQLLWVTASKPRVWRENYTVWIAGVALDTESAKILFLRWLAAEAKRILLPHAEQKIAALGLSSRLSGFTLRYTRSLWGRCSVHGNILLNPLILLAPLPVVHYLIVHEACHLRHMNHAAQFWALVAFHCPDWRTSRRWLKTHGQLLVC